MSIDNLSKLLSHISIKAGVFYTGNICGVHEFDRDRTTGHLHLIRKGPVKVVGASIKTLVVIEPTLLFLPRPEKHRLTADNNKGADVVCATVQFGGGEINPISESLPDLISIKLAELKSADTLLSLMFEESSKNLSGKQGVLDRLCEVLMICLIRYCLDSGLTNGGSLALLADEKLSLAVNALYENPSKEWKLTDMANMSHMSRAQFSSRFKEVAGITPAEFMLSWRIMLAQKLLLQGKPLKQIAHSIGYGNSSSFIKAFSRATKQTPGSWIKNYL